MLAKGSLSSFSLVLLTALLALACGSETPSSSPSSSPSAANTGGEEMTVVVADFENGTTDPEIDRSLEVIFRSAVDRTPGVRVVPEAEVSELLKAMGAEPEQEVDRTLGLEIARRENARVLILGRILPVTSGYSLIGEIVDPESGEIVFTHSELALDRRALLQTLDLVSQELRAELAKM